MPGNHAGTGTLRGCVSQRFETHHLGPPNDFLGGHPSKAQRHDHFAGEMYITGHCHPAPPIRVLFRESDPKMSIGVDTPDAQHHADKPTE